MKVAISAGVSGAGGEVNGSRDFSTHVKAVDKLSVFATSVYATHLSAKAPAIEKVASQNPGDLQAILGVLGPVIDGFDYKAAKPIKYSAQSVSRNLGLPADSDGLFLAPSLIRRIDDINAVRRYAEDREELYRALLSRNRKGDVSLKPGARQQLLAKIDEFEEDKIASQVRIQGCRDALRLSECERSPEIGVQTDVMSYIDGPLLKFKGWVQEDKPKAVRKQTEQKIAFRPTFEFFNSPVIQKIEYIDNDEKIVAYDEGEDLLKLLTNGVAKDEKISSAVYVDCPQKNHSSGRKESCSWLKNRRQPGKRAAIIDLHALNTYRVKVLDFDGGVHFLDIGNLKAPVGVGRELP